MPKVLGSNDDDLQNKLLGTAWVRRLLVPRNLGRDMVTHCAMEMNHLARFLPDLYALYHPETATTPREKNSCKDSIHEAD
jgi:hypothetical protein